MYETTTHELVSVPPRSWLSSLPGAVGPTVRGKTSVWRGTTCRTHHGTSAHCRTISLGPTSLSGRAASEVLLPRQPGPRESDLRLHPRRVRGSPGTSA